MPLAAGSGLHPRFAPTLEVTARREPALRSTFSHFVPVFFGHMDAIYALGVMFAGSVFLYSGFILARQSSNQDERRLLLASIAYLSAVFVLLITCGR